MWATSARFQLPAITGQRSDNDRMTDWCGELMIQAAARWGSKADYSYLRRDGELSPTRGVETSTFAEQIGKKALGLTAIT